MTPPRFSDDELLALIEGELPADRAKAVRDAVRDGDLELAGRLIDMAEHRDFLREMKIDRADLNPDSARTPEGVVAAAIAAAEREALVPTTPSTGRSKRAWWAGPLAACAGLAAMITVGVLLLDQGTPEPVPYELSKDFVGPPAPGVGIAERSDQTAPQIIVRRDGEDLEDIRRKRMLDDLAREVVRESRPIDDVQWPEIAQNEPGSAIEDLLQTEPLELPGGSGVGGALSDTELAAALNALEAVGIQEVPSEGGLRFAGTDPMGFDRSFTLEEAAALAKSGRLAIEIDQPEGGSFALAGGYLSDDRQRYAVFVPTPGAGGPDEVEQFRTTERVTSLTGRVGEALGSAPRAIASYSFEAAGSRSRVSDLERATMLELIAAVVSPLNAGPNGSRIRLIELPFDASDEPSVSDSESEDPFWWLQPEADYSQRGTALIPVVVK